MEFGIQITAISNGYLVSIAGQKDEGGNVISHPHTSFVEAGNVGSEVQTIISRFEELRVLISEKQSAPSEKEPSNILRP